VLLVHWSLGLSIEEANRPTDYMSRRRESNS
jgi:hypothetical protein